MSDAIHSDDDTDSMRYLTIMIEQMLDQNRAVLEAVTSMQVHVAKIPAIQDDISELKRDMQTVKAAVKATNTDVIGHKKRLNRLETVVYSPA